MPFACTVSYTLSHVRCMPREAQQRRHILISKSCQDMVSHQLRSEVNDRDGNYKLISFKNSLIKICAISVVRNSRIESMPTRRHRFTRFTRLTDYRTDLRLSDLRLSDLCLSDHRSIDLRTTDLCLSDLLAV